MRVWVIGARPKTLPAAIAPVMVGTALAGSSVNWIRALLALLVSLLLQIGVNYANDYSDGIRGTDADRIGPVRITQGGLATARSVKTAAYICFASAAVAGTLLAAMTTWWLIAVGGCAIVAAWRYTGGANPYGYLGLGELFVFLFFGLVATVGTFYVQVEEITSRAILASVPVGLFACLILMVNNIRDRERDAVVGKRTLAVRLGDRLSRYLAAAMVLVAHLMPLAISLPSFLATLLISPLSLTFVRGILGGAQGFDLIPYIARTGRVHILFSLALSIGLLF